MLALDENNPHGIMKAISNIIFSCCEDISNPLDLPIYDVENIFLQIRAKSVGEIIDLTFKDDDTGELITEKINISDIKLNGKPGKETLELKDDLKVTFRHPILKDFINENIDLSETEGYYNLISNCLIKIETPEEILETKNYETSEVKDFLESMNKTQFTKVLNYFSKMPKLSYTVNYKNSMEKDKTIKLEGIQDFFGLPSVTLV